jgi:hypothetical protein
MRTTKKVNSKYLALVDQAVADAPFEWTAPSAVYSVMGEVQPSGGTLTGWSQNVPPRLRSSLLLTASALSKLQATGSVKK